MLGLGTGNAALMLPLRGRAQKEQSSLLPQGKGASQSLQTWVPGPTPPVTSSVAWGSLLGFCESHQVLVSSSGQWRQRPPYGVGARITQCRQSALSAPGI